MAKHIWMASWENCSGFKGTSFHCQESVSFVPGSCGVVFVFDGVATGIGEKVGFATIVSSANPAYCPTDYPFYGDFSGDCAPTSIADQPCDCLNGGCVPKTTYNTPGIYVNLAACQSGCAKNSNCTGECVDPAEIAALKQAVNTLQSKICK
jgi:hypothetical protein